MSLETLLKAEHCIVPMRVSSKKQCFREMARRAAELVPVDEREILSLLLEREMLGSTGTGHGVAIPHARLKGIDKAWGFFAKLESPIEFDSIDSEPVDLVFLLLAPAGSGSMHLKSLSKISRLLRSPEMRDQLRATHSVEECYEILTESGTHAVPKPQARRADLRSAAIHH